MRKVQFSMHVFVMFGGGYRPIIQTFEMDVLFS